MSEFNESAITLKPAESESFYYYQADDGTIYSVVSSSASQAQETFAAMSLPGRLLECATINDVPYLLQEPPEDQFNFGPLILAGSTNLVSAHRHLLEKGYPYPRSEAMFIGHIGVTSTLSAATEVPIRALGGNNNHNCQQLPLFTRPLYAVDKVNAYMPADPTNSAVQVA